MIAYFLLNWFSTALADICSAAHFRSQEAPLSRLRL